jgi:hypothetical protein
MQQPLKETRLEYDLLTEIYPERSRGRHPFDIDLLVSRPVAAT